MVLASLRQPARALRIAAGLWVAWAIVVWNVIFDHVIVAAGRAYIDAAYRAARGAGPYAHMDDWMRPAVVRGFWIASIAAVVILGIGLILGRLAGMRAASPREVTRCPSPHIR